MPGLASFGALLGIGNVKIGYFTRMAPGTQSITGIGFKPKIVIFIAAIAEDLGQTQQIGSSGFDDGTIHGCTCLRGDSVVTWTRDDFSILSMVDETNYIGGYITSLDEDGFTITWTMEGTSTVDCVYLAMK